MARMARVIAPGIAHHITQRGNRRQPTFFGESDYKIYLQLMSESCNRYHVEIWAYCLMPNHVHLVAVPETEDGLSRAIGEAHRKYTRMIHFREGWRGHLWQGRFTSYPMDNIHTIAAVRYVELNPVRAGLVERPEEWPWSSVRAHLTGEDDVLVKVAPMLGEIGDWSRFLMESVNADIFRRNESTGRPLGGADFIQHLGITLDRVLAKRKPGPKHRESSEI
jgi:putative transposase